MAKNFIAYIILVVFLFLYASDFEISFSPFHLKLQNWLNGIGIVLIIMGLFFMNLGTYQEAYMASYKKAERTVINKVLNQEEQWEKK